MKLLVFIFLLFGPVLSCFAQSNSIDQVQKKDNQPEQINRFYYFEIPAVINGSNLDPSAISSLNANFSESKISFKVGFPSVFRDSVKNLKHSGFIQPSFKAANGISTLYKSGSPPLEYGLSAGYSYIARHRYWVFKDTIKYGKNIHSSEDVTWLNIIGNIERVNYNMFKEDAVYGNVVNRINDFNGGVFVSINHYFSSVLKSKRWKRHIISLGIGYAKTNNYSSLKKRTYEEGIFIYNTDSTSYQSVSETKAGAIGEFKRYEGLASYAELFVPIFKSKKNGALHFGNRVTYYGIGKQEYIINGSTGFYVNLKDRSDYKPNQDKSAKDILSFSLTGQFNQLNNMGEDEYMKDNFTLVLQLAIPLRFH